MTIFGPPGLILLRRPQHVGRHLQRELRGHAPPPLHPRHQHPRHGHRRPHQQGIQSRLISILPPGIRETALLLDKIFEKYHRSSSTAAARQRGFSPWRGRSPGSSRRARRRRTRTGRQTRGQGHFFHLNNNYLGQDIRHREIPLSKQDPLRPAAERQRQHRHGAGGGRDSEGKGEAKETEE